MLKKTPIRSCSNPITVAQVSDLLPWVELRIEVERVDPTRFCERTSLKRLGSSRSTHDEVAMAPVIQQEQQVPDLLALSRKYASEGGAR
jgi:hypothetical protein